MGGCIRYSSFLKQFGLQLVLLILIIFQFRLDDAQLVNKIFIPTKFFANELKQNPDELHKCTEQIGLQSFPKIIFKYRYLNTYGDEGEIVVKSAAVKHRGVIYVAFALLALFPLRLKSHFVTSTTSSSNFKLELWKDILIVNSVKGSVLNLYGFKVRVNNRFKYSSES